MFGGENIWIVTVSLAAVLVIAARVLIEKMLTEAKANARFGMGIALFVIYTGIMLLVFNYFCVNWNGGGTVETVEGCFVRLCVAFVLINVVVLAVGILYYMAREKRKLSEMDRMKLEDL